MATYKAGLRRYGGVATVFVNDRPIHGLMPCDDSIEPLACTKAGVYLVNTSGQVKDGKLVEGSIVDETGVNTTRSEKIIDEVLKRDPDALIALGSCPEAPWKWSENHPEEMHAFAPGEPGIRKQDVVPPYDASFASVKWRNKVSEVYEEFSRRIHLKYDGRVIMHVFGAGNCEEWNPYGVPDCHGRWWAEDFSPAMHNYFRTWLRKRYEDNIDALRKAWSNSQITFETASVPTRAERLCSDWFTFRHPKIRHVTDYLHAYTDAIADDIIAFADAIKRGTNGETLVCTHSGGFLDNGLHAYLYNQTAANTLRRVERHPHVDIFTCPISFLNRRPGGSPGPMMPTGSLRLHNKMYLHDEDSRFHTGKDFLSENNVLYSLFGLPRNEEESVAVMKRNVGRDILNGWSLWWHDCLNENYMHDPLPTVATRLVEIGRTAVNLERGFIPDMAVVADERASFSQQCANRLLYPLLYAQRVEDFCHAGISWDAFEAGDLLDPNFPSSKLILMLNLFELEPKQINAIREKLSGSGAVVVWFVAPGIQGPEGFDFDAVQELTGFRVRALDAECNPRVTLTNYDHPITSGLGSVQAPHSIGTGVLANDEREGIYGPIFYINDSGAMNLGMLDGLYQPGLAVKELDGWTSVYSVAPRLSRQLLRNLAKIANIHSYLDTEDMVCVSPELILIHGVGKGTRNLTLPQAADVIDLWTGKTLASQATECPVEMSECDTKLLFYGNKKKLKEAQSKANPG